MAGCLRAGLGTRTASSIPPQFRDHTPFLQGSPYKARQPGSTPHPHQAIGLVLGTGRLSGSLRSPLALGFQTPQDGLDRQDGEEGVWAQPETVHEGDRVQALQWTLPLWPWSSLSIISLIPTFIVQWPGHGRPPPLGPPFF